MASPLLSLPYELRIYIYELVLCTQGTAQLGPLKTRKQRQEAAALPPLRPYGPEPPPSPNYPPRADAISSVRAKEDADSRKHTKFEHLLAHMGDPSMATGDNEYYQIETYGVHFVDGIFELDDPEDDGIDDLFSDEWCDISETEHAILTSLESESNPQASYLDRFGYELGAFKPLDVTLLRTCREINLDATPIFYAATNFVLETDLVRGMRFLKTLPPSALLNITTLTLSPTMLRHWDSRSLASSSASSERPSTTEGPAMNTPLGAFLVAEMPKLSEVFLCKADRGGLAHCRCVYPELEQLLCHQRIQRLHYVSMGSEARWALEAGLTSEQTMRRLLSSAPGEYAGYHEFECCQPRPFPDLPLHWAKNKRLLEQEGWFDRRDEYVRKHSELFGWKWGDRDIAMSSGAVEAVVTVWLK